MKPVLIIQHQKTDSPAYLSTWLKSRGVDSVLHYSDSVDLPKSIDEYSALASLGGSMSANDQLLSNHRTEVLILQAMYRDIPVLGHCLGGQLMAKALGAEITKSTEPEIGWQTIEWIINTDTNRWIGLTPTPAVMHWHYDMFNLPVGATLLGSTAACHNQAFTIGKHIGMQFHIEVDTHKIGRWVDDVEDDWVEAQTNHSTAHSKDKILRDTAQYLTAHQKTADVIYTKWLSNTEWNEQLMTT